MLSRLDGLSFLSILFGNVLVWLQWLTSFCNPKKLLPCGPVLGELPPDFHFGIAVEINLSACGNSWKNLWRLDGEEAA